MIKGLSDSWDFCVSIQQKPRKKEGHDSTMAGTANLATQHPLQAVANIIKAGPNREQRAPRMSHMQSANEGPADIIAKVSDASLDGVREDDGPYFTNNEGHPFPDP